MANQKHVGAKVTPKQARMLADLGTVSAEDRARLGITDEMVRQQLEQQKPLKGVHCIRSEWKPDQDTDVEPQVRVVDYDANKVLFSGSEEDYKRLMKAKED